MEEKTTRSKNSVKNASISLIYFLIGNVFSFLMRTVLIRYIGIEYAGLNSLLTNIIGMLNIAELGLGTAVGYSLYKPLAEKNYKIINEILCLYKYLYRIIALIVALIGIGVTIFINIFVNTNISIIEVRIDFVLYLIATILSYLLTFLNVLPSADQKNYMIVSIQNNGKIIKNIIQLIFIVMTKNFYIWVIIEVIGNAIIYLYTNIKIKKEYTWYEKSNNQTFNELINQNKDIVKRTKDLVFHKIGGMLVYQTDNILISYFGNLTDVGIYSNYMLIYSLLTGCVEQAFMGVSASIGNLIIKKEKSYVYNIWKEMYIIMIFAATLFTFLFYKLVNPFISVFFGEEFILQNIIVFAIAVNIMFRIIKNPIDKFKEAYGIFWDIYSPIVESILNLLFSILFAIKFGILGVVIGTIISNIVITIVWKPYVIFKHVFNQKFIKFCIITLKYIIIGLISILISNSIINIINFNIKNNIINLIELFAIYGIISTVIILTIFLFDKNFRNTLSRYINILVQMLKNKNKFEQSL